MSAENKRSPNFTKNEEILLINLVRQYQEKVENKKTDATSNKMKQDAWILLAADFNSQCIETCRDVKILKNKYENLKKRCKQRYADNKKYIKGTGPSQNILTDVDVQLKEILGTQLDGLPSEFDSDALYEIKNEESTESILTTSGESNVPFEETEIGQSWQDYRPSMLKTVAKVHLVDEQRKWLQEKFALEKLHMEELHEIEKKYRIEKNKLELDLLIQEKVHKEELHKQKLKKLN